ncbi:MAG: transposase, partial [Candidatus Magasanikbacteria bacterium]|nr:transposase [Candidatus Magasanikbacteria bacterium]
MFQDRYVFSQKDVIYIMDRGYFHFKRLYTINKNKSYFIVRAKESLSFRKLFSRAIDKIPGLRCDQTITLKHFYSQKHYPEKLRRVKYYDTETDTHYVYLTNNFE